MNRYAKSGIFLILFLIIIGAMISYHSSTQVSQSTASGISSVEPALFATKAAETNRRLIDIRTPEEFVVGHLEGAENIDFYTTDFKQRIAALDRDAPYALYCRSGNRTSHALAIMRSLGFTNVVELQGGILAWEAENRATCSGIVC
jgi:phage shock protein E